MRKQNKELKRIISLIENERLCVKNNFEELLLKDLKRVIKDYFELASDVNLEIAKINGNYSIKINFNASNLISFSTLPEFVE
ncbi:MAG: hypothetical protein J6Q32_05780 [Clostridia bacterium]|nr:hypothetical protein [Clostridia bacterium]